MSDAPIQVFLNEQAVTVPAGSTVLVALQSLRAEWAKALERGNGYVTDGVGRRIALTDHATMGAIYRVVGIAGVAPEPPDSA